MMLKTAKPGATVENIALYGPNTNALYGYPRLLDVAGVLSLGPWIGPNVAAMLYQHYLKSKGKKIPPNKKITIARALSPLGYSGHYLGNPAWVDVLSSLIGAGAGVAGGYLLGRDDPFKRIALPIALGLTGLQLGNTTANLLYSFLRSKRRRKKSLQRNATQAA